MVENTIYSMLLGIQFKTSNDGVYVSDTPLGPFVLAEHNPLVYRPEGFTTVREMGNFPG